MKSFVNAKEKSFTFSSCQTCQANCCNGLKGTIFSQLVLEDFELVSKNFPILFIKGDLGFLKPVVLLTNGQGLCRFNKDYACTIYEQRPAVCRIYPISPDLSNEIFIDTNCPAVNEPGELIIKNGKATPNFHHERLDNYLETYITMHQHLDPFNKNDNLYEYCQIKGMKFYAFHQAHEDEYLKLHLDSLEHFNEPYFKEAHS